MSTLIKKIKSLFEKSSPTYEENRLPDRFPAIHMWLDNIEKCADAIDRCLHFTHVDWTFEIIGRDGFFNQRVKARNRCAHRVDYVPFSICGDSPINKNERLDVQILRNPKSVKRAAEIDSLLKHATINFRTYHAKINPPLRGKGKRFPGETCDISFSCGWRGTFNLRDDYVFVPISHYRMGVDKISIHVLLHARPTNPRIATWDLKEEKFNFLRDPPTLRKMPNQELFKIHWETDEPELEKVYILQFHRGDI